MKTASMVLGIIGGALAIIFAFFYLFGGSILGSVSHITDQSWENIIDENVEFEDLGDIAFEFNSDDILVKGNLDDLTDEFANDFAKNVAVTAIDTFSVWFYVAGILSIVGGILGIIGGVIVKNKNVAAGVLMIIAAVISCLTVVGFFSTILLVLAAVFAFIREKSSPPPLQA